MRPRRAGVTTLNLVPWGVLRQEPLPFSGLPTGAHLREAHHTGAHSREAHHTGAHPRLVFVSLRFAFRSTKFIQTIGMSK